MIVKIWPIKADYAGDEHKVGGEKGLRNSFDYIMDENKVIANKGEVDNMQIFNGDEQMSADDRNYNGFADENAFRVINYMANESKIEGKYISGYMCDPEVALEQFKNARELTLNKAGIIRDKETGALAYHIVQSFPEDLDISNEEVHQCGIELCQKIGLHQAVICSHVHPAIDELSGEVHGRCKHNHILINAYVHPDKFDPEKTGRIKYNDCNDTYALLRAWNDEIAIEHGLPIIRNPDNERVYSWKEVDAVNKGLSWKERMRTDIEETRRAVDNWDDFKKAMQDMGYEIRDGVKHVSYTAPDNIHVARGKTLGREYTKENLELYWSLRKHCYRAVEASVEDNSSPTLADILRRTKRPLRAAVPLGAEGRGEKNRYYYIPLNTTQHDLASISTYFNADELYDICDEANRPIAAATGAEIIDYIESQREENTKENDNKQSGKYQEKVDEERGNTNPKKHYYTYALFINTRTRKPYRTSLYAPGGRRRGTLELMFILAMTVIKKESDLWEAKEVPKGKENDIFYAPRNRKIQNMLDAIYEARDAEIETPGQLDSRLQEAGSALSRARSALTKTKRAKEKMDMLTKTLLKYQGSKEIAENILSMEEGPEKESLKEKYADILEEYRSSKAVLYRYQLTSDEQIKDFEERYKKVGEDIAELEERFESCKEEYRRLKKIEHSVSLAQNTQYCYGPTYTGGRSEPTRAVESPENEKEENKK